jgi:hypothetical protein
VLRLAGGALRGGVEVPDRLDGVAGEVDPDGLGAAGREEVDHAAADAELAVRVHRILAREARVDEERREVVRIHVAPDAELGRRREQPRRRRHARQQRRRRRHDHARAPPRGGVQRPRARRQHAEVRSKPAIGIDFVRREREDGGFGGRIGEPLQRAQEEPDVADRLVDVGVGGHDDHHRGSRGPGPGGRRLAVRRGREIEGAGGGREAGHGRRAGRADPRAGDHALQQRLESQGCGHV